MLNFNENACWLIVGVLTQKTITYGKRYNG